MRYNPDSLAFDFDQMTAVVRTFGWEVIVDWEVLDGRAFAVVERVNERVFDPADPAPSDPVTG